MGDYVTSQTTAAQAHPPQGDCYLSVQIFLGSLGFPNKILVFSMLLLLQHLHLSQIQFPTKGRQHTVKLVLSQVQ